MIHLLDIYKSILLCLVFTIALRFIEVRIESRKIKQPKFRRTSQAKYKIMITTAITFVLTAIIYNYQCRNDDIDILECLYITPSRELVRNIAIAVFINTTLFLGGLHQELYNGKMRKKFMRFYKKQFQWNLFKKLFIVPLCLQVVYRALLCRIIDPDLNHPVFFAFYSGILFALSHYVNYYSVRNKFGSSFASKATAIHMGYNLVFGVYISHIFTRSPNLITSLVIQVYANFMGYPEYFQVFKVNMYDQRSRKTMVFYLCGVVGCLICCLYL